MCALMMPWMLLLLRFTQDWRWWCLGGFLGILISLSLTCLAEYRLEGLGRYVRPRPPIQWRSIESWFLRNRRWFSFAGFALGCATVVFCAWVWSRFGDSTSYWYLLLVPINAILASLNLVAFLKGRPQ